MTDRSPNEPDDVAGREAGRDVEQDIHEEPDIAGAEPTTQYTAPYPQHWSPAPAPAPASGEPERAHQGHDDAWQGQGAWQPQQAWHQQPQWHAPQSGAPDYGQASAHSGFGGHAAQPSWEQPWNAQYDQAPMSSGLSGGSYFESANETPRRQRASRRTAPLVGALLVGALVGGAAGAGWTAAFGPHASNTAATSGQPGGNITVNDYNSASVVTAVAAKATGSVVTINATASSASGTGSGVVLTADGYIVTNTHVVTLDGDSGSASISVTTSDGHIYPAKVVGTDPTVDLAVVKIDAKGLTPMPFADSAKLNVGDTAIAIGAPLGLSNTVTDGIVSTLNRSISVASSAPGSGSGDPNSGGTDPFNFGGQSGTATNSTVSLPVIQTDAAINPGNSGGALLDSKARLIGINVAIASAGNQSSSTSQSGSIGVGFAIPSDLVKRVSDEIIKNGKATHGLLGASVTDATADQNATQVGALIKSVTKGGAADQAGIQPGDVVTALGGIPITSGTDLTAQVRYFAGGAKTSLTYVRSGQSHTVDVTLGTYASTS
ncbi:S1C family serine protease [Curtobacterium ammoniigenes]|uniref:S1C family serine protease n=1 Tax=Curtobacterium ammoniigenes TaxID=395387 RepID=UPI000A6C66E7|nr:trypsin-like peptidase domain-containing protein [Curtobacterium ammoniigenes]